MVLGAFDPETWGTAAEWFAAVASAGALIVALLVFRSEGRQLRSEAQALRDDRHEAKWRQAQQIEARLGQTHTSKSGLPPFGLHAKVTVINNSDAPVRVKHVQIMAGNVPVKLLDLDYVVAAGAEHPVGGRLSRLAAAVDSSSVYGRVIFTDARGQRWRRSTDGALTEI